MMDGEARLRGWINLDQWLDVRLYHDLYVSWCMSACLRVVFKCLLQGLLCALLCQDLHGKSRGGAGDSDAWLGFFGWFVWLGLVWVGLFGLVWFGLTWLGLAWLGLAWLGWLVGWLVGRSVGWLVGCVGCVGGLVCLRAVVLFGWLVGGLC